MTAAPCPSGKVGHASQHAAKAAATAVGQKRTHDRPRVYQCPTCAAWHLTSAPKHPAPPAQRLPKRLRRRGRPPAVPQPATPEEVDAWFSQHSRPAS